MPTSARRFLRLAAFASALLAAPAGAAPLVLEKFFNGRFQATGTFDNARDGTQRRMNVAMRGRWDGATLTLREDFVYSDGERDRKTWVFTKVAEGRYVGRREDVIGTADVTQDGDDVRLSYVARVKTKDGSSYDVRFNDLLRLTGPRTVLNTADVTYYVVNVGKVALEIRRR
jgi:hypothetical protein